MTYISVAERNKLVTPSSGGYVPVINRVSPSIPSKLPFDATNAGIAVNTIKGVLGMTAPEDNPYLKVTKDIAQGVARTVARVGISSANQVARNFNKPNPFEQEIDTTSNSISNAVFGGRPIKTVAKQITDTQKTISPYVGDTGSKFAAAPLVLGSIALDLSSFGGGKGVTSFIKGEIPEQFFKFIAKEKSPQIIEDTLKGIGLDSVNSKILASKLAETKTIDEVKNVLVNHETAGIVPRANPVVEKPVSNTISPGQKSLFSNKVSPTLPLKEVATQPGVMQNLPLKVASPSQIENVDSSTKSIPPTKSNVNNESNVLDNIISKDIRKRTPPDQRVGALWDTFVESPRYTLDRMGLGDNYRQIEKAQIKSSLELPNNIQKITDWQKQVPSKSSAVNIFKYLDGDKEVKLTPIELKISEEIKTWLAQWADKLGLKPEQRITDYITHIWDGNTKEIPEEISKIIRKVIPKSVYDPFLLNRTGAIGYKENVWDALDAYVKRATRKVNMDPALESLNKAMREKNISETSQLDYLENYIGRINMRPTKLDTKMDNEIKQWAGDLFGARPTSTITKELRRIKSRATLGGAVTSAVKNLTQAVNTFSELGTKYTTIGYAKLVSKDGFMEPESVGVFVDSFIHDRNINAIRKTWEKIDNVLYTGFQVTEKINRGAAYWGGKQQYLDGKAPATEVKDALGSIPAQVTEEDAKLYGKYMSDKTQFTFGNVDTPLGLSSDIAKTMFQFQTFTVKQMEFVGRKAKRTFTGQEKARNAASLARYILSSLIVFGTVGKLAGMKPEDMIPSLRMGGSNGTIFGLPTPPSLDLPVRAFNAVTGAKNKYGTVPSPSARLKDVGSAILTDVVPGGTQINRSVGGVEAVSQGKSTTVAGHLQYKIPQTVENYIRAILFGKNNLPAAQNYYNKVKPNNGLPPLHKLPPLPKIPKP